MKKQFIASIFALGCMTVFAQTQAAPATPAAQPLPRPGEAIATTFEDTLTNQLQDVRSQAGLDGERYYSAISVVKVGIDPRSPNYALARQYTFAEAFGNALQQIAGEIRQDMENAVSNGLLSDTNGLTKADLDPKVAGMVNDAIKKQLIAQGVDLNNPDAVKAAMPKVVGTSSFKQATTAASQLFLSGVVCFKTVCKGDEIGVLVYYSPMTKKFAEALVTKQGMPTLPPGINIRQYLRSIKPTELASTFGPRVYVDERGQVTIVAFAQNPIIGNENAARIAATRLADSFIQDFVGSNFAVEDMLEGAKDSAQLMDAAGNVTSTADVSQRIKSLAQRSSGKLTYHGIRTGLNRVCRLPSGHRVIVIARVWSPALQQRGMAASQAADQGAALRDAAVQNPEQPIGTPSAAKPDAGTPYQNRNTEGDGATGFVL